MNPWGDVEPPGAPNCRCVAPPLTWLDRLRQWWWRQKQLSKLAQLKFRYEEMTGPEYCPPNACCPSCFHGGALDDVIEDIRATRVLLGLPQGPRHRPLSASSADRRAVPV